MFRLELYEEILIDCTLDMIHRLNLSDRDNNDIISNSLSISQALYLETLDSYERKQISIVSKYVACYLFSRFSLSSPCVHSQLHINSVAGNY